MAKPDIPPAPAISIEKQIEIQKRIDELGIKKNKLAQLCNVTPEFFSSVINGKRSSKGVYEKIESILDIKLF